MANQRASPVRRATMARRPLSGPTYQRPPALTATGARSLPTPGSTTQTKTAPVGMAGAKAASR